MENFFSIVRQRYGLSPMDQMKNLDVNTAIWSIFMSVTLGKDYTDDLRSTTNQEIFETVFSSDTEVDHWPGRNYWIDNGLIGSSRGGWRRLCLPKPTSFLTQCYVWEVSVLSQSKHGKARSNGFWKLFRETRYLNDLDRIDGEQVEFEWKSFQGFTTLGILDEIQQMMTESKCELEQFKGRIIFMSMYHDKDWRKRGNRENCIANARRVTEYARRFPRGHWSFLGPGSEEKRYRTHVNKLDGEWKKTAWDMMLNFAKSGHPKFRATSALERGELKSKGKGLKSTHFNGSDGTLNWFFEQLFPSISLVSTEQ